MDPSAEMLGRQYPVGPVLPGHSKHKTMWAGWRAGSVFSSLLAAVCGVPLPPMYTVDAPSVRATEECIPQNCTWVLGDYPRRRTLAACGEAANKTYLVCKLSRGDSWKLNVFGPRLTKGAEMEPAVPGEQAF
ncbi:hypothetical protein B0T17DRAFT_502245 [Bombardia bombarda]|uniref:Uncharacterized protein n=1 Tax=Bombardia bombarda TaxID=252184 RepID=A0AA40CDN1_9PEZI|nr:hypothetical protein B0T17DRAFT_502245 [Bombardia bombarda]